MAFTKDIPVIAYDPVKVSTFAQYVVLEVEGKSIELNLVEAKKVRKALKKAAIAVQVGHRNAW